MARVPLSTATARPVQKVSRQRGEIARLGGIGAMASRISDMGIKPGAIMTITEYLAATVLIALIVWAALGLLMQES